MSAGAVFKLIANDGKSDRLIMATKLLQQRIKDVMCARKRAGKADITPTLVDLERTHILYVNSHFKPFAAIGYEYNKVRPQSGNPTLGGGVTFSIPQFGDFFHDMVCRTRLSSFYGKSGLTPQQSTAGATGTPYAAVPFPTDGYTATGAAATGTFYNIVDHSGNLIVKTTGNGEANDLVTYRNFVRYCEYPGNRLFNLVKFDVNGNPLDQYDQFIPVMLEKFCVSPNKRVGHDRLVGQEVAMTGYSGLCDAVVTDVDSANTPAGINKATSGQSNQTVGLFDSDTIAEITGTSQASDALTTIGQTSIQALNASTSSNIDMSRKLMSIVNGPQTPKPVQAPLELWNKLRFWFNDDVRLSIASVSIPFGQRFISIDLCTQAQLAFEYPSIYLETINCVSSVSGGVTRQRKKTYTPIFQSFGMTDITIEKMELYINNIFVNPEIHDIYIKRIGFSLIRVYRQHTQRCNQEGSDEKLLSQLKWPIEYMFVGLRPVWNTKAISTGTGGLVTGGNQNMWRDWHRMTRVVEAECDEACLAEGDSVTGLTVTNPSGGFATSGGGTTTVGLSALTYTSAALAATGSSIGQVIPDHYYLPVPTVDTLSLTSHGITIFDGFNDTFFNQYMPFHYGGTALNTPDDVGALFVNMALFPRSNQPSGHLNISRARETYLKWTSSYVSAKTPADLITVAVAINFLLITDGSAVLRYST